MKYILKNTLIIFLYSMYSVWFDRLIGDPITNLSCLSITFTMCLINKVKMIYYKILNSYNCFVMYINYFL